jgi:hypothetical protein
VAVEILREVTLALPLYPFKHQMLLVDLLIMMSLGLHMNLVNHLIHSVHRHQLFLFILFQQR